MSLAGAYCPEIACFLINKLMCMAAVHTGEVFRGLHVPAGASDAAALFAALQRASRDSAPPRPGTTDVTSVNGVAGVPGLLSCLRGPWSLVFWAAKTEVLRLVLLEQLDLCIHLREAIKLVVSGTWHNGWSKLRSFQIAKHQHPPLSGRFPACRTCVAPRAPALADRKAWVARI